MLAWIVPTSALPRRFENRCVWLSERGEVLEVYEKHHPVRALDRPYARAAGVICYVVAALRRGRATMAR